MSLPNGSLLTRIVNRVLGPLAQESPPAQALPDRRFGDVLTAFWVSHWSKKNSETRRQYDTCLRLYIRPEFDDVRVSAITRDQVRSWHAANDSAPVLANRALKLARHCFTEMYPERVNPFARVTLYPERSRSRRFTDDERERWLTALFALRAEGVLSEVTCDALYVLRFTAARKSEILKLQRDQVDLHAKVALIEDHKTDDHDNTRTIQLEAVIDVITRRVAACERDGTRFLFPGRGRTGHLVSIQNAWRRVCERAGLIRTRDLVPHLMRGDFATKALDEGEELRVVQEILGHADIGTTAKYAKCGKDTARKAAVRTAEKMGVRPC